LGRLAGDARTHRASFVNTLVELNQALDFPQLKIPREAPSDVGDAAAPRDEGNTAGGVDLGNLKTVADEQKELIAMLLRQQTDSESAINIKVSELESLQRFNRESELCVRLMEDELGTANIEIETLQAQVADVGDMKALIRRFTQESSEMLTIIDGMEHEIASLQTQLKN
jgi:chromosome segregation ATPase